MTTPRTNAPRKNGWTPELTEALRLFWLTDKPVSEFARANRKTERACYQRAANMRLPGRTRFNHKAPA